MSFNIYCDESCHLEHDGVNVMTLGAVWCPTEKVKDINARIRTIKSRNGIPTSMEMKWTKISPAKVDAYLDLVDYFFDDDDLHLRCLVVPNKSKLDHRKFHQSHDEWYYKMYFDMLKAILSPCELYEIYIDIKDSHSYTKAQKLREVCSNSMYDFSQHIIRKLQPIRSEEVQIMQIVDILIGAIAYENRVFPDGFEESPAKRDIIDRIKARSKYSLRRTTLLREDKCNLFVWEAQTNE